MGDSTRISRVVPGIACIYGESKHSLFLEAGLPDDNEVIMFAATSCECIDKIEAELHNLKARNAQPSIQDIAHHLQNSAVRDKMNDFRLGQPPK